MSANINTPEVYDSVRQWGTTCVPIQPLL